MTKQAQPPPPGDRPSSPAPPPPPAWRHWLLPIALLATLLIWIALPTLHAAQQVNLTYSQFLTDVSAHKVKTVNIQSSGPATGTLTDGHAFNTVIPVQLAGSACSTGSRRPTCRSSRRRLGRRSAPRSCRG